MEINELSQIAPSQAAQFLPKQRFNIPKSTIQKVKSTITSLNSGIVSGSNFKQSQSTPFSWVIGANNMSIIDLSQCYFNIAGTLEFPYGLNTTNKRLILGNLFTSSLFQNATLELGGAVIAMNANPGIDANMQAMLKFDYNDLRNYCLCDREFMINEFDKDFNISRENYTFTANKVIADETCAAGTTIVKVKTEALEKFKGCSIYWAGTTVEGFFADIMNVNGMQIDFDDNGNGTGVLYGMVIGAGTTKGTTKNVEKVINNLVIYGNEDLILNYDRNTVLPNVTQAQQEGTTGVSRLPFRCKLYLSDLFNYTVDSLDYVFNREIKITLTRAATSNLICNVLGLGAQAETAKCEVVGTDKFELICFSYLLTDTARQQMIQYYSQPIETLYGIQTTNLTPLYNATANTEQTITLPLTVNYDTKAIILAFPKCSNALVPMSTNPVQIIEDIDTNSTATNFQPSWYYSNANSYNYAGLRYIRISNTNNSSIYTYDFLGTVEKYKNPSAFNKSFDITNQPFYDSTPGYNERVDGQFLDYREAYSQYKELRLLFGKSPDNGIDYYTFLKDYTIFPIDLAGTNIPPNTRIMVTICFAQWTNNYNPLNYGNIGNNHGKQSTTNMLAIFLGSDVLAYNPDGTCTVKHVLSANPKERNVNLM